MQIENNNLIQYNLCFWDTPDSLHFATQPVYVYTMKVLIAFIASPLTALRLRQAYESPASKPTLCLTNDGIMSANESLIRQDRPECFSTLPLWKLPIMPSITSRLRSYDGEQILFS